MCWRSAPAQTSLQPPPFVLLPARLRGFLVSSPQPDRSQKILNRCHHSAKSLLHQNRRNQKMTPFLGLCLEKGVSKFTFVTPAAMFSGAQAQGQHLRASTSLSFAPSSSHLPHPGLGSASQNSCLAVSHLPFSHPRPSSKPLSVAERCHPKPHIPWGKHLHPFSQACSDRITWDHRTIGRDGRRQSTRPQSSTPSAWVTLGKLLNSLSLCSLIS